MRKGFDDELFSNNKMASSLCVLNLKLRALRFNLQIFRHQREKYNVIHKPEQNPLTLIITNRQTWRETYNLDIGFKQVSTAFIWLGFSDGDCSTISFLKPKWHIEARRPWGKRIVAIRGRQQSLFDSKQKTKIKNDLTHSRRSLLTVLTIMTEVSALPTFCYFC